LGVTTLYVTHDQIEAMTMGDRVAVLKDGYLQQVDTPQNLYDRPDNVFVGAFIGSPSMNLYQAKLVIEGDGGAVQLGSQTLQLDPKTIAARPALRNLDGADFILGIRPEDFEDAAMVEHDTTGKQLTTTAALMEALGSEIMVHFSIDAPTVNSGDPDAVEDQSGSANAVGRFHPRSKVRSGQPMTVAVATENMHFFDASTRKAIWN
jgi:multiple sugar transport system ATP-binding protein